MARLFFPANTLEKMKRAGVTENEAIDVFHTGRPFKFSSGLKAFEKKYDTYGYIVGVCYTIGDTVKGEYVIRGIWKRKILYKNKR